MLRLMNILAVLCLLGSAVYAYTIKYATLYQTERMATLKRELTHETDALTMMKAEWAHIAAPVRIEALADQYLGGQVMELTQIATPSTLPEKGAAVDKLGATLNELGLGDGKPDPALAARLAQEGPAGEAVVAKPGVAKSVVAKPAAAAAAVGVAAVAVKSLAQKATGKPAAAPLKPAATPAKILAAPIKAVGAPAKIMAAPLKPVAAPAKTAAAPARPVDKNLQKKPGGVDHDPTASIRTGR